MRLKIFTRSLLVIIASLLISGGIVVKAAQASDTAMPTHSLIGTWQLIKFQSASDTIGTKKPDNPRAFTMTIADDGRVYMALDCNRATGTWKAAAGPGNESGQFTFGPMAGTRALCRPPNLDEFILRQTEFVRSFLLRGNKLHLSLMADGGILSWQRLSGPPKVMFTPESPEDGGPRNWQVSAGSNGLNLRSGPTRQATVITAFPTGTIFSNLGCQDANDQTWCDVQPLEGGPRGYVAAMFLVPAISPSGEAMFGPDQSARRAGEGAFDATGELTCRVEKVGPNQSCAFGVARSGGGYATVVVTKPSGQTRALFFIMGRAIGADTSEADNRGPFSAKKEADRHLISIGTEFYMVPDAVIFGG